MQLPGESVDVMFTRFQTIVNKMRANITVMPYQDHERALKLLHALDRKLWGVKVDAIIESPNYETLTTDELFSKLKSTEIDIQSRAKLENPLSSSMALVSGCKGVSANSSPSGFALSSLVSIIEEQVEALGDDELTLISSKFKRFYDNRRNWRKTDGCYGYGEPGHLIADCPNK